VTRLLAALLHILADLKDLRQRWALVGGLAVSVWVEPRTTRDIDLVVAVESDHEAEGLVRHLLARGYRLHAQLEQEATKRLATVRLLVPGETEESIVVDLLFASSGLEPEVVSSAQLVEIAPGVTTPVATVAHLLAMKVLAGRLDDMKDIRNLLAAATAEDLQQARDALLLIQQRRFDRKKDLQLELAKYIDELKS